MSQNILHNEFSLRSMLVALRPNHWIKNTLVFCGLVFTDEILNFVRVMESVAAFVVFCGAASFVYLLNDLKDAREDRLHPAKRLRPIAAGEVSPLSARLMMAAILPFVVWGSWQLSKSFCGLVVLYLALNVAYTFFVKRIAVLDVMAISSGFVLRVMGGVIVTGLTPSPWVVLCTMMLALFVGFGKRRHELTIPDPLGHRSALSGYSRRFLDTMLGVSAAAAVVTYALFTVSDEMVARFQTGLLVFTTPLVTYGIFRYLYLILRNERGEDAGGGDPTKHFLSDRPLIFTAAAWFCMTAAIVNAPPELLPWWATRNDATEQEARWEHVKKLEARIQELEEKLAAQPSGEKPGSVLP